MQKGNQKIDPLISAIERIMHAQYADQSTIRQALDILDRHLLTVPQDPFDAEITRAFVEGSTEGEAHE